MTKLIFIRGIPATGKTTITKEVLKTLKLKHKLNCAYICEDNFRKQMQFKYKAKDLDAHLNSVELIKTVTLKLLELDSYDYILIEGLFRYKQVLDKYDIFLKEHKFEYQRFQLELNPSEAKKRDVELRNVKSEDLEEIYQDINKYTPKGTVFLNADRPIEVVSDDLISKILK